MSDTLKSKNITADWSQGGGGVVRIAKLHVDQLSGFAWNTNSINISNNLEFKAANKVNLMRFTTAHGGRGDDKAQGLVLIDGAELRIHNRGGTNKWATHLNHKTQPNNNSGYYGNWIRGGTITLNENDDRVYVGDVLDTAHLTVRGTSTFKGTVTAKNITVSDTLKSKNITADWTQGGGGVVRIAKLHVDQLYGMAWEGAKTNTILISNNLIFSTPNPHARLMKFRTAHGKQGNDAAQGLVIIDDAELRIANRKGGIHDTHFNHKTGGSSGYYGNWLRE